MNTMIAIGVIIITIWAMMANAKHKREIAEQKRIQKIIDRRNAAHRADFLRACDGHLVHPSTWTTFTHKERQAIRAHRKWKRKN